MQSLSTLSWLMASRMIWPLPERTSSTWSSGNPRGAPIAADHRILELIPWAIEKVPFMQRIARHYAQTHGVAVQSEQIILTCGYSPVPLQTVFGRAYHS